MLRTQVLQESCVAQRSAQDVAPVTWMATPHQCDPTAPKHCSSLSLPPLPGAKSWRKQNHGTEIIRIFKKKINHKTRGWELCGFPTGGAGRAPRAMHTGLLKCCPVLLQGRQSRGTVPWPPEHSRAMAEGLHPTYCWPWPSLLNLHHRTSFCHPSLFTSSILP